MSQQTTRPIDPVVEEFTGESLRKAAKRAFHATRPKFFPASVLPVLAGTAWGVMMTGRIDILVFVLALVATVCVQAAGNVLNDVGDDSIGTDPRNEKRIYPYTGGSRFIQTGILTKSKMVRLGTALLVVASLAGLILFMQKGPVVLLFGLIGIAIGVLYSLGPVKLSSLGLGEISVAVAFGVLPVSGAAWLQGATIDTALLLFSVPISIWVAFILLINEVPDMEADGACGKDTLPVRFGRAFTANLYLAGNIAAAAVVALLAVQGYLPLLAPLAPILLLAPAWRASAGIRVGVENRESMTQAIESTLAIHTVGCLWLTGCALFNLWW